MLAKYVDDLGHPKLKIWTSWLKRTIETTKHMNGVQERFVKKLFVCCSNFYLTSF